MRAWEDFIRKQEELLGKKIADEWLRPLKVVHFDSGNLYLEAKDSFHVLWFEEHIRPLLKARLLNNNFRPVKVHLTTSESNSAPSKKTKKEKPSQQIQFTFDPLDPAMTLDNFIVSEENRIAFSFLRELIASPERSSCNPIYLWAPAGCGKTHLMTALAHAFQKLGLNPLYAKAETFTEHVVSAIRSSEMQAFRRAYRSVGVLLIDDVHIFARKNATQEELFHTFNTLHTSGKPIILSSRCPPASLEEIEPRLVSRFEWGINIPLKGLKDEDCRQMLLKRCSSMNFPLPDEDVDFLMRHFKNAPSLNRALEALILRSHLDGGNRKSIEILLSDLIADEQGRMLGPEKILSTVSAFYGLRTEDLTGKSQSQECSLPRQIAMYLCRNELKLTFEKIGQIFHRDHSTVMTSVKQIEGKMNDRELAFSITEIKNSF